MNIESEDLNYLFSYLLPVDMERDFANELLGMVDAVSRRIITDFDDTAADLRIYSLDVFERYLRPTGKPKRSLDQMFAETSRDRAIATAQFTPDPAVIQKVYDMRKSYFLQLSPLEREFLERV